MNRFFLVLFSTSTFEASFRGEILFPQDYPEKAGAVLSIESPTLKKPKAKTITIVQRDMMFLPHVSVVPVGSTITFKNEDPSIHGIKSESGPLIKFHAMMGPKTKPIQTVVNESGVSELLCDIHAQMNAFIVVVESSITAMSNKTGDFEFKELPPTPFTVKVWHEVLPPKTIEIKNTADLENLKKIKLETWN